MEGLMQTYIFYKAIDVGKIVFRATDMETGKWLDAPEFRRLEQLLIFLWKNAEKIAPLKDSGIVFNDDGKLTMLHLDVAHGYYPVCKFTIPPRPKKHVGWKKLQGAYQFLTKRIVDGLDF